jgi:plasmid maintenance system antidote protein VapI
MPPDRASRAEEFLELPEGYLAPLTTTKGFTTAEDAPTMLGWLLAQDHMAGHLGEDWGARLEAAAEVMGRPVEAVIAMARGHRRMAVEDALKLCRKFFPGMNPWVFRHEVGQYVPEDVAVANLFRDLACGAAPGSWDEAVSTLLAAEADYLQDDTEDRGVEWADFKLNSRKPVPKALQARVELIGERLRQAREQVEETK